MPKPMFACSTFTRQNCSEQAGKAVVLLWRGHKLIRCFDTQNRTCTSASKPKTVRMHPINSCWTKQFKYTLVHIGLCPNWLQLFLPSTSTASMVVHVLRKCFNRKGISRVVVTDHRLLFDVTELRDWHGWAGLQYLCTANHHSVANSLLRSANDAPNGALIALILGRSHIWLHI